VKRQSSFHSQSPRRRVILLNGANPRFVVFALDFLRTRSEPSSVPSDLVNENCIHISVSDRLNTCACFLLFFVKPAVILGLMSAATTMRCDPIVKVGRSEQNPPKSYNQIVALLDMEFTGAGLGSLQMTGRLPLMFLQSGTSHDADLASVDSFTVLGQMTSPQAPKDSSNTDDPLAFMTMPAFHVSSQTPSHSIQRGSYASQVSSDTRRRYHAGVRNWPNVPSNLNRIELHSHGCTGMSSAE
jgi:hypothetical protein